MSATKDQVIDAANNTEEENPCVELTMEKFNLGRTKKSLHDELVLVYARANRRGEKLQEAFREIALLQEQDRTKELTGVVAERDDQIAKLKLQLQDAQRIATATTQVAQNNTRLSPTLDNVAKGIAALSDGRMINANQLANLTGQRPYPLGTE